MASESFSEFLQIAEALEMREVGDDRLGEALRIF